jgi:DNA-binding winged helix-turn-helix (wHTH) protein
MLKPASPIRCPIAYEFDGYHLDARQRRLARGGRCVALFPKALDTLTLLLDRQGETLAKDFMLRSLWPGVVVQENSLARAISDVRRALADATPARRYIITLPRRGYMFAGDVSVKKTYGPNESERSTVSRERSAEGHRDLSLGRLFENKRTSASVLRAIAHFERAIAADPSDAEAHAALARAYNSLSVHSAITGGLRPHEFRPKARAAALAALARPNPPVDAYTALASVQFFYEWDFAAALTTYRRARQVDPRNAEVRHSHAVALSMLGRHEEALREIELARALDPVSLIINANVGFLLYHAGRYREAVNELRGALLLDPHFSVAHHRLGLAYEALAMYQEAEAEFAAMAPTEADPLGLSSLAYLCAISGRETRARRLLGRLLRASRERYVPASYIAQAYAGLNDRDAAFGHLERAFDERAAMLVGIQSNRRWSHLRSDPRFEALVQRVGLTAFDSARRAQS